mmetsp:Transcript_27206/g.49413  ORF Transcript_27206/g.49413 Transcript_27206/m.49413 type:complete len:217 (+) Transcript_27206:856-1506(+)
MGGRSHSSTEIRPSGALADSGSWSSNWLTKETGAVPAHQTERPTGRIDSSLSISFPVTESFFFVLSLAYPSPTSVTRVFKITCTPFFSRLFNASSLNGSSNCGTSSELEWQITTLTLPFNLGYVPTWGRVTSSAKSKSSPANSTPVGPPPTMRKVALWVRSSSFCGPATPGRDAYSKHSPTAVRRRLASSQDFSRRDFDAPGTPLSSTLHPTATTR